MLFRLSGATAALALTVATLSDTVAAVNCAVCPPSVFYAGLSRTLTLQRQSSVTGYVQC
ncbi:hypothetical protein H0H81_011473, partial [Sphagnurus paluster]